MLATEKSSAPEVKISRLAARNDEKHIKQSVTFIRYAKLGENCHAVA